MMKILLLITAFSFLFAVNLSAQEDDYYDDDEYYYEDEYYEEGTEKALIFDAGFGGAGGMSLGLGFRYSYASLMIGFAGFANDMPNYAVRPPQGIIISPNQPLPGGYERESFTGLLVTADLAYHYQLNQEISAFGMIGYYSQQDSILARETSTGDYYRYAVENTSGIAFGLGGDYGVSEWITLGLGYHTKRGVFARFSYRWL